MLNAVSKLRKDFPREDDPADVGALPESHLNLNAEDTLGVVRGGRGAHEIILAEGSSCLGLSCWAPSRW